MDGCLCTSEEKKENRTPGVSPGAAWAEPSPRAKDRRQRVPPPLRYPSNLVSSRDQILAPVARNAHRSSSNCVEGLRASNISCMTLA